MAKGLDLYRGLIAPGTGWRWMVVLLLALAVSALEALGALLIYVLVGLAADAGGAIEVPVLGDVREFAPGLPQDRLVVVTAVAVAGFFVLRGAAVLVQSYVQARVANAAKVDLATRLLRRYLQLPYSFHLQRNSAQLIRNANDSVDQILSYVLLPAVWFVTQGAILLALLVVLVATAPLATGFAALALAPLVLLILRVIQPKIGRLGTITQLESGRSIQLLQQSLHGFRDITVLGRQEHFVRDFRNSQRTIARMRYLRDLLGAIPPVAIEVTTIGLVAAFIVTMTGEGPGSLAVVGLFAYAALRIMPALYALVNAVNQIRYGQAALMDVQNDLRLPVAPATPRREPLPFDKEIALDGVSFTYPGTEHPTLRDLNLVIRAGESVGIVGVTGAGKSTLVDLLIGLSPPTAGRVLIDGIDLAGSEGAWQMNLGMVSQQVYLLDDTLRRNIALGLSDEEIDDDLVNEAVRLAQLEGFVAELPAGLESLVGERGTRVSGGQRQRIAIARALYGRPKVLLFDEGTSALDNVTEAALVAALDELSDDRTIVTIAHRLTTVQNHDRIVYLRAGRIEDVGTFTELVRRSPSFRQMAKN
jgi:ATP-binding cassette, subfamily B, bacterial PglK